MGIDYDIGGNMLTKEQVKDEIRKRIEELGKHDFTVLDEALNTSTLLLYLASSGLWKSIAIERNIDAIKFIYQHVIVSEIFRTAEVIDALKKEGLEKYIDEISEMFTGVFPQAEWKYRLERIDEFIYIALTSALRMTMAKSQGK